MPIFGKTLLVEVSRGCPWKCRFCMVGYQANPYRTRSFSSICKILQHGFEETPVERVAFIGAALSNHPDLTNLCWNVLENGKTFILPSLRADRINPDLVEAVSQCQKTITLAPETGSDNLLSRINKGFDVYQFLSAVELLKERNFFQNRRMISLDLEESLFLTPTN